ncbi:hypothetical protein [Rhodoferax sp. WC2427]|uniref:hypothetical protein n=1 Tax=Rhodoferax sp. WC2427 TaxID=3234144 RepID=UPI0034659417
MHIQASRLQSTLATLASAAPTRQAAPKATETTSAPAATDTVTISQAAKDLLAQSQASVSLSSRAMDLIQQRNPDGGGPGSTPGSASPQAQVRKVMDQLTTQHTNRQISDTQYRHDMAFYTRIANTIG